MKTQNIRIARLLILLLISNTAISSTTANDEARVVIVLLDVTRSFTFKEQAIEQIQAVIKRLGPGDEFLLIEIGPPPFQPDKKVKIQAMMPSVPEWVLVPPKNIYEYKKRQRILDLIWAKVRGQQKSMLTFLEQPIAFQKGGTDLYAALEYAAQRFMAKENRSKILLIYSDLVQDLGVATPDPPKKGLAGFDQAHVSVLFVPWENQSAWESKEKKWRTYFEACHAQSFNMHEPAESKTQTSLSPSRIPTKLKSPFED